MSGQTNKRSSNETPPQLPIQSPRPTSTPTVSSIETTNPQAQHARGLDAPFFQQTTPQLFRVPQTPHSTTSEGHRTKNPKIAIPRLKKSADAVPSSARSSGRHRVNHACEPCRQRKTKCSGERPICKHCQDFKISCFYADGKRDRAKKQFGSMAEKVADFEKLLKDLTLRVGEDDAAQIRALLEQDVVPDMDGASPGLDSYASNDRDASSENSGAESDVSATVGSTGALDKTLEDFAANEKSRSTGFMGKNSEITWMQRLRHENVYGSASGAFGPELAPQNDGEFPNLEHSHSRGSQPPPPDSEEAFSVQDASYHLDDFAIPGLDSVDAYELPTFDTANHLFDAYIARVHPSFPIIGKATFTSQYRRFMNGEIPGAKWLAILNLIFAISARYSHLIRAEWRGDDRDHLIYFTRARVLSMNSDSLLQHPDLQQIQVSGLMAFYLLCTSQVNRSWTILGLAIRSSTALGLNMRNESPKTPDSLKEIRYRVWWSLYVLEHQLGNMTGRATSISDDSCTTPLPVPVEEDRFQSPEAVNLLGSEMQKGGRNPSTCPLSSNATDSTPGSDRSRSASTNKVDKSRSPSAQQFPDLSWTRNVAPNASLYFLEYVQLTRLTQQILNRLYTPFAAQKSWAQIQAVISQLEADLESWHRDLPDLFDFKRSLRDQGFMEVRWNLGFFFYSTRMKINRPCLCRLDRKIPRQSARSREFNRDAASRCVDAAQEMLALLPDEPNAVYLNSIGPWWHALHFLVQATTVIMLEMSFRASHMPEEASNLLKAAKKAVRWLHQMAEDNVSARRAWYFCDGMLRDTAPRIGGDVNDLPRQAPVRDTASYQGQAEESSSAMPAYSMAQQQAFFQSMPDFNTYTMFDQYQPQQNVAASYRQSYQPPTSAELEFMNNAYHDQGQHDQEDLSPEARPN